MRRRSRNPREGSPLVEVSHVDATCCDRRVGYFSSGGDERGDAGASRSCRSAKGREKGKSGEKGALPGPEGFPGPYARMRRRMAGTEERGQDQGNDVPQVLLGMPEAEERGNLIAHCGAVKELPRASARWSRIAAGQRR